MTEQELIERLVELGVDLKDAERKVTTMPWHLQEWGFPVQLSVPAFEAYLIRNIRSEIQVLEDVQTVGWLGKAVYDAQSDLAILEILLAQGKIPMSQTELESHHAQF